MQGQRRRAVHVPEHRPALSRFRSMKDVKNTSGEKPTSVDRQEILQLLADSGYSGGRREDRLKEILTELTQAEADAQHPDPERSGLIREIRSTLDRQAKGQVEDQPDGKF